MGVWLAGKSTAVVGVLHLALMSERQPCAERFLMNLLSSDAQVLVPLLRQLRDRVAGVLLISQYWSVLYW
jgi:hypothetical protein